MPETDVPIARVMHRTGERWRLKIPERKRDLAYFIRLYEALRRQPEIREVTANPITASLLVWFARCDEPHLTDALTRDGLMRLVEADASAGSISGSGVSSSGASSSGASSCAEAATTESAPHPSVHHAFHVSVNDTRILVFLIMLGLSLYQLSKKQFLTPALTMALYLIDLLAGLKLERDAAARAEQAQQQQRG